MTVPLEIENCNVELEFEKDLHHRSEYAKRFAKSFVNCDSQEITIVCDICGYLYDIIVVNNKVIYYHWRKELSPENIKELMCESQVLNNIS